MSLRSYLAGKKTEATIFRDELSPRYEIPAIIKEYDGKGPLVFENVEDHYWHIVANVCDSRECICGALGVDVDSLHEHLSNALETPTTCIVRGEKKSSRVLKLSEIPVLTHYMGEQGPYITSALVYARNPEGSGGNVSYHRMDVIGEDRLSICVQPGHLKEYIQEVRDSGGNHLDISISIGNHPAVMMASALRPPLDISEFDVANTLLGGGLELFECPDVDALAPIEAELVLEGRIRVNEEASEGPYVCVTGTMKESKPMPIVELVGAICKDDCIYQGLLGGGVEHRLLESIPNEVKLWRRLKAEGYDVKGVHMTPGGSSWLHGVVSVAKKTENDGRNILEAMFDEVPALKHVVVVDSDINPYDSGQVEWALSTRFQGDKDLMAIPSSYASRLDPSSDLKNKLGCKLGFDASKPLDGKRQDFEMGVIPSSKRVRKALKS